MRRGILLPAFLSLFLLHPALTFDSTPDTLSFEVWVELDPFVAEEGEYPLTEAEIIRRALEEARTVFSAMVYGYRFFYVPSDVRRGVSEEFVLEPVAEIPWGDPGLSFAQGRVVGNLYFALVRYRLAGHQLKRLESWMSNSFPSAKGEGRSNILGGRESKIDSLGEAAKNAIRTHFREKVRNKPKSISGEIVFLAPPYSYIDAGSYVSTVTIKIDPAELVPYRVY